MNKEEIESLQLVWYKKHVPKVSPQVPIYPDAMNSQMFWLAKRKSGLWYLKVSCDFCRAETVLFRDVTRGKGELDRTYLFTCPFCKHEGNHRAERFFYSLTSDFESEVLDPKNKIRNLYQHQT